jgi:hypothetical protein
MDVEDETETVPESEKDIEKLTKDEKKQLKRMLRRYILSKKHSGPRCFRMQIFKSMWKGRKAHEFGGHRGFVGDFGGCYSMIGQEFGGFGGRFEGFRDSAPPFGGFRGFRGSGGSPCCGGKKKMCKGGCCRHKCPTQTQPE